MTIIMLLIIIGKINRKWAEVMSVLIRFSDIVLNTMAIVYHQEGRRIIDTVDIEHYWDIVREELDSKNYYYIDVMNSHDVKQKYFGKIRSISDGSDTYYAMYPWIDEEELAKNYKGYLFSYLSSDSSSRYVLKRSQEDLEHLSRLYSSMLDQLYEDGLLYSSQDKTLGEKLSAIRKLRRYE